jgi:hypothetical protein
MAPKLPPGDRLTFHPEKSKQFFSAASEYLQPIRPINRITDEMWEDSRAIKAENALGGNAGR